MKNWADFKEHVQLVIRKSKTRKVVSVIYDSTPFDQKFAIVVTKVVWWAVRIILDEEHTDLRIIHSLNCDSELVIKRKQFSSEKEAMQFANQTATDYKNGDFENLVRYRIRKLPIQDAENIIMPGDLIRREFIGTLAFHEGVCLFGKRVAHINPEEDVSKFEWKKNAGAQIVSLENFLKGKKTRILVPCIRRRTREEICNAAYCLVLQNYGKGLYDLLKNNCQHFASLCVFGQAITSDKTLIKTQVRQVVAGKMACAAVFTFPVTGPFALLPIMVYMTYMIRRQQFIQSKHFRFFKDKPKSEFV